MFENTTRSCSKMDRPGTVAFKDKTTNCVARQSRVLWQPNDSGTASTEWCVVSCRESAAAGGALELAALGSNVGLRVRAGHARSRSEVFLGLASLAATLFRTPNTRDAIRTARLNRVSGWRTCMRTVFLPVGARSANWSNVSSSPPACKMRRRACSVARRQHTCQPQIRMH